MSDYTKLNVREMPDLAPQFGLGEIGEARFPRKELGLERTGFSHQLLRPGCRQGFGHRHDEAEEVYVVLSGGGRVKLDDDVLDLGERDVLRVSPGVTRQFEAGGDGLELLAVGARHEGDVEMIPGWWSD